MAPRRRANRAKQPTTGQANAARVRGRSAARAIPLANTAFGSRPSARIFTPRGMAAAARQDNANAGRARRTGTNVRRQQSRIAATVAGGGRRDARGRRGTSYNH